MHYVFKFIPILVLSYLLITTLIYFYLADTGKESQLSSQRWWQNSQEVAMIQSSSSKKCQIHPNVYSPSEIKRIFNYMDHKPCKLFSKDVIAFDGDQPIVKCLNPRSRVRYMVDQYTEEIYGGSKKEKPKWTIFEPNLSDKQFVFIKCSFSAIYAYVFNRFSQKASDSANEVRMRLGNNEKPMSVLLLVLDSISRYSFQRNLPKTYNFLKEIQENKEFNQEFSVFEFEKSATPMAYTKYNMAQIYFGKSVQEIEQVVGSDPSLLEQNKEIFLQYQENAIWRLFSTLGYVTMFSHGTSFDFTSALTGRYIKADHVFTNFWRYMWGVIGRSNFDDGKKCIGTKNMHEYSFEYTYQFFYNYPNNNKFAYVHSDAAHENTGNVKTIDSDLLKFLIKYLKLFKSRNENLAVFLLSDHGHKRLKNASQWDPRTFFEFHTPFTYLIATKDVINTLNAYENLKHNEEQLVSRYDINLSLKHLAYFPYNVSFDDWYPQAKDYYTYKNTVSLFNEKVSTHRTCADIGVDKEYCLCSWYEPVENNENEKVFEEEMIKLFYQYLNYTGKIGDSCSVDDRIEDIKISSFRLKKILFGFDSLYRIKLKTKNENEIIADFNFCLEHRIKKTKEIMNFVHHPYSFFKFSNYTGFLQLKKLNLPSECQSNFCEC